jgi:hypothetical protein
MANANKPTGLSPVKYLSGANWDGKTRVYWLDSTSANAMYVGDPVALVAGLDAAYAQQSIDRATAGATMVGVALGFGAAGGVSRTGPFVDPANLTLTYAPATKTQGYFVAVADDPNTIFEIQENSSSGGNAALTKSAASKNANFVYAAPAAGATFSGVMLDVTSIATTSTLNLKLLGLKQSPDNSLGYYAKWWVKINNHSYSPGIAGT